MLARPTPARWHGLHSPSASSVDSLPRGVCSRALPPLSRLVLTPPPPRACSRCLGAHPRALSPRARPPSPLPLRRARTLGPAVYTLARPPPARSQPSLSLSLERRLSASGCMLA